MFCSKALSNQVTYYKLPPTSKSKLTSSTSNSPNAYSQAIQSNRTMKFTSLSYTRNLSDCLMIKAAKSTQLMSYSIVAAATPTKLSGSNQDNSTTSKCY